ncbi:STAS domain-containing protein [Stakelama tenebrarum]|uniref:STAS domain-containing protein n=1 Tax=Stakelama tenebrarum TaxID=2711215 RepID=A0A6G6Y551_9SPHN|nr:STAS domain-containing protein [Sphingosinithalassobacter tenebrarum]QIG79723.1 STAS domain-containing protein [Sphingosinithalassobacter tenebrarum]
MDSPQQPPEFVPQLVDLEDILPIDCEAAPAADAAEPGDAENPAPADEDRAVRLPAHASTVAAEDIKVRMVLAADLDGEVIVDASEVESVGQAVLQLLVAARRESEQSGYALSIENPSQAFVDRVTRCRLTDAIGIQTGEHQ